MTNSEANLVEVWEGKEIPDYGEASVFPFAIPAKTSPFKGDAQNTQVPFFQLGKQTVEGISKVAKTNKTPAVSGHNFTRGSWVKGTYAMDDGFLFTVRVKVGAAFGNKVFYNLICKARARAPRYRVTIPLLANSSSNVNSITVTGRFDILDVKDLYKEGARISKNYDRHYKKDVALNHCEVEELEPEIIITPSVKEKVVTDHEGKKVKVFTKKMKRKIL